MSPHPFWLYGHRGACAELPENTIEAFARALECGCDALEMDVHMTRDGYVLIHHDPTGERMAGVADRLAARTFKEVRGWDVGWGFVDAAGNRPHAGKGFVAPTLHEVLDAFPGVRLNIDVKQRQPDMVPAIVNLLHQRGAADHVLLTSFETRTVRAIRAAGYRGPLGMGRDTALRLLTTPAWLLGRLPSLGDAAQLPTRFGPLKLAARWLVERTHATGARLDFWTINDPAEAVRLLEAGADGVMTDDPARVAPALGKSPG